MSLLTQSLTIKRNTRVSDGQGGVTEELTTVKVCVGRISPAGGAEYQIAEKYQAQVSHAIYVPPHIELKLHDVVENSMRKVRVTVQNLTPSIPRFKKALGMEVLEDGG